ncbi:hypothetical protein [Paracidovorax anthurii]|uniref:Uncharacterized protein n=1 Tax=Paracidovorax anthurii TaxID=78229 RepID=A0A328YKH1_9BURK|nr:hypothetical protein [Paracidovorax anthurii]RAR74369.1 hypothetical protein AX018_10644 [Paracidovorax anthurii]
MHTQINYHANLDAAIHPLRALSSFKDPTAGYRLKNAAHALEAVRAVLAERALEVGITRLHAQGTTLGRLTAIAMRQPASPLEGLITESAWIAANWASSMQEFGWHGLCSISKVSWGLGFGNSELAEAGEIPTIRWIACGDVPPYLQRSWQILGGVIDAPLLRALGELAKNPFDHTDARNQRLTGNYGDTVHQLECTATALAALDLRLQEYSWMFTQLVQHLNPMGQRVLRALEIRSIRLGDPPPANHAIAPDQQHRMRAFCAMLLHLLDMHVIDDFGALTPEGGEAVVEARRLLLSWAGAREPFLAI